MSGEPRRTVIRAAAGCGKTTALACAYLKLIARGHEVRRVIAITFTRRAAAELVERVGLALRAATGEARAIEALGAAAPVYLAAAPDSIEIAERALEDLGSAPIGTTDHFVNELLSEFALHATLRLDHDHVLPLDVGMLAVPDLRTHLDAAARMLLDPPEEDPPDEVSILTPYFTLGEIHTLITRASTLDALEVASCAEVLTWMAHSIGETLSTLDLAEVDVEGVTNQGCEWTHEPVRAWIEEGSVPAHAPRELVSWTRRLHKGKARWIVDHLREQTFDFGVAQVRMDTVLEALRHPYDQQAHLETADVLRAAIERLRVQVAHEARLQAALQGELSHDQATRAAAQLAGKRELQGRFSALLVDEVQDASPDQLLLYEALSQGLESVFVGDARQSIYLFRGGEPAGLDQLAENAELEQLVINRRSTPSLVAVQRSLFAALQAPMHRARLKQLESLGELEADPERAADELEEPVRIVFARTRRGVEQADDEAIQVFWQRLQELWKTNDDTAAILCPTWRAARRARDLLGRLSGDPGIASLEGGDHWLREGVGRDVAFWLRALSDPHDDIAWLAVLKHPSIGLTDAAFARFGRRTFGLIDVLDEGHDPRDVAAWQRTRPALREALHSIGREDTAHVLDRLFSVLQWRALLAAGPGGQDDVARLDVLLDWIGDADSQGRGVDGVVQLLSDGADVPRIRLERARRTVTCTTVFQAKGLAWDHVCVLSPGRSGRLEPDADQDLWIDLPGGRKRVVGLTFDPEGGLLPFQDPLRRLAVGIHKARYAEEGARLAYVAVTRAKRSVTLGLPDKPYRTSIAQGLICNAWRSVEGVTYVEPLPTAEETELPTHIVVPAVSPFPAVDRSPPHRHRVLPPSAASARFSTEEKADFAAHLATRVKLAGGRTDGHGDLPPPHDVWPEFTPSDWGTLVHGWFAAWGFKGPAKDGAIAAWLELECGRDDAAVRDWLQRLSVRLAERGGPAWDLVQSDARLYFEIPVIGLGGPRDDLFLAGRPDLLAVRKKRVSIIDFKAGSHAPYAGDDLVESASLATYGPQLEAYREVLERHGYTVDRTLLWFVRSGAVVQW